MTVRKLIKLVSPKRRSEGGGDDDRGAPAYYILIGIIIAFAALTVLVAIA
jgi:hypothetical protein